MLLHYKNLIGTPADKRYKTNMKSSCNTHETLECAQTQVVLIGCLYKLNTKSTDVAAMKLDYMVHYEHK